MQTSHTRTGYSHLRKGRVSQAHRIYLITTVCANRETRFANAACAAIVAEALRDCRLWRDSTPLCWVLMPDHLHVVLKLGESESLAHLMNRMKSVTARVVREADGGGLPVWMVGYHDHALRKEEDLAAVMRYVLANPIRRGLAASVEGYPHWGCVWGSEVWVS